MKVIGSWSGGKDSCFACYKAGQQGHELAGLLNFVSKESDRCCFHGIDGRLLARQADLMGLPIVRHKMSDDKTAYEAEFKAAVRELKQTYGAEGMVFGDIYLDDHKYWVERVCRDAGVQALEPLWGLSAQDVALDFIKAGFRALVVSGKAELFAKDIAGREFDAAFVRELIQRNICPCGEHGEFHTLVVDGPLFRRGINITKAEAVFKQGFWNHWSLDIQEWDIDAGLTDGRNAF
jgi:diphthine-ammonia ligase